MAMVAKRQPCTLYTLTNFLMRCSTCGPVLSHCAPSLRRDVSRDPVCKRRERSQSGGALEQRVHL